MFAKCFAVVGVLFLGSSVVVGQPHAGDLQAYENAVASYRAEVDRYTRDLNAHNAEAQRQRDAVRYFNSLPANQRTQGEADRLNRWGADVNYRAGQLNSWGDRLRARARELDQWRGRMVSNR